MQWVIPPNPAAIVGTNRISMEKLYGAVIARVIQSPASTSEKRVLLQFFF
jgi:hypothetical protein